MEGIGFLDIVFFAMLAAFIILRLRSVLGRRTGHEQRPSRPLFGRAPEAAEDNVVALPERAKPVAEPAEPVAERDRQAQAAPAPGAAVLTQIKIADPSFDAAEFVKGARIAYEMIVVSFASGDTDTLRPLLAEEVYGNFARAIREREARGESQETTLVAIGSAEIIDTALKGRVAEVAVKFVSELVNVTRDANGQVIAGDPRAVDKVTDIWTFGRDTRSRDPNWRLTATRSAH
ncbi:MAG: Tim44 domain-containing protein [Alphaproteobacteria bacterium]|nr:Tim44 domain-containing protein [Alphaproteobacteria bacterium]